MARTAHRPLTIRTILRPFCRHDLPNRSRTSVQSGIGAGQNHRISPHKSIFANRGQKCQNRSGARPFPAGQSFVDFVSFVVSKSASICGKPFRLRVLWDALCPRWCNCPARVAWNSRGTMQRPKAYVFRPSHKTLFHRSEIFFRARPAPPRKLQGAGNSRVTIPLTKCLFFQPFHSRIATASGDTFITKKICDRQLNASF